MNELQKLAIKKGVKCRAMACQEDNFTFADLLSLEESK